MTKKMFEKFITDKEAIENEPEDVDNPEDQIEQHNNIKIEVNEKELSAERKEALDVIKDFCVTASLEFQEVLNFIANEEKIPEKIKKWLEDKNFNLPSFSIYDGEEARNVLESLDLSYGEPLYEDEFLVIFQLPKPIARFWDKGGQEFWGEMSKDATGAVVEWGKLYRQLMPVVWENMGFYESEVGLIFERKNSIGEHDPEKFYYIWGIS